MAISITATTTKTVTSTTTMPIAEQQAYPSTTVPTIEQQSPSPETTYENRLQAALEHARRLTHMYGYQSADVAIAWETVEELRTFYRERLLPLVPSCQASFERYCLENPHAFECRSYDC
ncbi:CP12 domain protein [Synechococcus sp. PCC 7335]|uniref:CP12 domain-containing protein n=1 Tax=Synechococcus sp. (strain ATCC 29403 / PCC 7335) TaxID=91464 RepID=UPI00017ED5F1|nr:CP12 domain-containing protein [Synechococcus sp. PCC 7335]EDX85616.1 CP12 domain protein [Synechococcus sp. PCC 7335]